MANRKILYGYQIIHGDLVIQEEERLTVQNIFTTYLAAKEGKPGGTFEWKKEDGTRQREQEILQSARFV